MAKTMNVKTTGGLIYFLQLFTGIFFLLLGLYGVMPSIQESVFSLSDANLTLEVIFGVLELISSVVLIAGLFVNSQRKLLAFVSFVIFIFWAARIVITKFVLGITLRKGAFVFTGGLPNWLLILAVELVLLVAILIIHRRYAD